MYQMWGNEPNVKKSQLNIEKYISLKKRPVERWRERTWAREVGGCWISSLPPGQPGAAAPSSLCSPITAQDIGRRAPCLWRDSTCGKPQRNRWNDCMTPDRPARTTDCPPAPPQLLLSTQEPAQRSPRGLDGRTRVGRLVRARGTHRTDQRHSSAEPAR